MWYGKQELEMCMLIYIFQPKFISLNSAMFVKKYAKSMSCPIISRVTIVVF